MPRWGPGNAAPGLPGGKGPNKATKFAQNVVQDGLALPNSTAKLRSPLLNSQKNSVTQLALFVAPNLLLTTLAVTIASLPPGQANANTTPINTYVASAQSWSSFGPLLNQPPPTIDDDSILAVPVNPTQVQSQSFSSPLPLLSSVASAPVGSQSVLSAPSSIAVQSQSYGINIPLLGIVYQSVPPGIQSVQSAPPTTAVFDKNQGVPLTLFPVVAATAPVGAQSTNSAPQLVQALTWFPGPNILALTLQQQPPGKQIIGGPKEPSRIGLDTSRSSARLLLDQQPPGAHSYANLVTRGVVTDVSTNQHGIPLVLYYRTFTLSASGTLVFSGGVGVTGFTHERQITPAGTLQFSGTAEEIKTNIYDVTGLVLFSGSAPISFISANAPTQPRLPMTGAGVT